MAEGIIRTEQENGERIDYLFRISIKALIQNDRGETLVVKEDGRTWWDLPGGGMNHDETIRSALARELGEEVNLQGDFNYQVLEVEDPHLLEQSNCWQVRLILRVVPDSMVFSNGNDSDEIKFLSLNELAASGAYAGEIVQRYKE